MFLARPWLSLLSCHSRLCVRPSLMLRSNDGRIMLQQAHPRAPQPHRSHTRASPLPPTLHPLFPPPPRAQLIDVTSALWAEHPTLYAIFRKQIAKCVRDDPQTWCEQKRPACTGGAAWSERPYWQCGSSLANTASSEAAPKPPILRPHPSRPLCTLSTPSLLGPSQSREATAGQNGCMPFSGLVGAPPRPPRWRDAAGCIPVALEEPPRSRLSACLLLREAAIALAAAVRPNAKR